MNQELRKRLLEESTNKAGEVVKFAVMRNFEQIFDEVERQMADPAGVPEPEKLKVNLSFIFSRENHMAAIKDVRLGYNRKVKFEDREIPPVSIDVEQLELEFEPKEPEKIQVKPSLYDRVIENITTLIGKNARIFTPCIHIGKDNWQHHRECWNNGKQSCGLVPDDFDKSVEKDGAIVINDEWDISLKTQKRLNLDYDAQIVNVIDGKPMFKVAEGYQVDMTDAEIAAWNSKEWLDKGGLIFPLDCFDK